MQQAEKHEHLLAIPPPPDALFPWDPLTGTPLEMRGDSDPILDADSVRDISIQLEKKVVDPIFASVVRNGQRDPSLPQVVFDYRKTRPRGRVLDALVSRGVATIPDEVRTRLE